MPVLDAYAGLLANVGPLLCDRFHLRADCEVDGEPRAFVLQSGDPIFPAAEPRRFDSKVEARFFSDFGKATPDWDLVREPEALAAGSTLILEPPPHR